jgi:hypothetical protein
MTTEAAKARDDQLVAAITVVLTQDYRFVVEDRNHWIRKTHEGLFEVYGPLLAEAEKFNEADAAVRFFLDLCDAAKESW